MTLESALTYIYSSRLNNIELTNSFVLYSMLSDMCNDTYENKEDVKIYWKVISKVNIYECLLNEGITDGVKKLKEMYSDCSEYFSLLEYKKMIEYTLTSMSYLTKKETKPKKQFDELYGFDIRDNVLYKYSGRKSVVTIPSNVKVIKANSIDGLRSIKKLIIPSTVELIETFAISNLPNLKEIDLGNVNKIEEYAFWNCNGVINCNIDSKPYLWDKNWNVFNNGIIFKKRIKTNYGV